MHSIAIAHVNPEAAGRLAQMIKTLGRHSEWSDAAIVRSESQLLLVAESLRPDLVLVDNSIAKQGTSELASRLLRLPRPPLVALINSTSGDELRTADLLVGYALGVHDYMLAPVTPSRLAICLIRARYALEHRHIASVTGPSFVVDTHGGRCLLALDQVPMILSDNKWALLWTPEREYLLPSDISLRDVEERFGSVFVRVHRSCLVNIHHVLMQDIEPGRLPDAIRVQGYSGSLRVARRRRAMLHQRLLELHEMWPVRRATRVPQATMRERLAPGDALATSSAAMACCV